ncbi:MAG: hypothetical protein NTY66_00165 [Candidatus Vogelbacteria bacterium]|nr:hypothetical protein [Candidatus Vogelbacteria bacterium]
MMRNKRSGFIRLILVIIVVILILSYFGVNLRGIVNSPAGQDNMSFVRETGLKIWHFCLDIWNQYLRGPVTQVWQFIRISLGQITSKIPR